ncbi:MAG: hypothetical protein ACO39F_06080, partial [Candidatus Nanopelagicaceae bacterium]
MAKKPAPKKPELKKSAASKPVIVRGKAKTALTSTTAKGATTISVYKPEVEANAEAVVEEKKLLTDWQSQSADLREFVKDWEPYFAILEDQQAVETGMSMKVREEEMFNLSQSYQSVPHRINNKDNEWLPTLVRASLVFDDDYAKLLNWIGQMERSRPTMRIGRIS